MSGAFRNLSSKYSSVLCSRRQLEWSLEWYFSSKLMRHCASTIVQRCITLGKTLVYSTGRQNFGLKYGSKFLMESHQYLMINWWNLIFHIPNPDPPPLTFFDISFLADLKIKVVSPNKPTHYQFKCLFILGFWHRRHFHCLKLFETLH